MKVRGTPNSRKNNSTYHNVAFVPRIMFNQISFLWIRHKGLKIVMDKNEYNSNCDKMETVHRTSREIKKVAFGINEGLFKATLRITKQKQAHASVPNNDHVKNIRYKNIGKEVLRESCAKHKLKHVPHKTARREDQNSSTSLERNSSDMIGSMKTRSIAKSRNLLTLFDECSDY